MLDLVTKVRLDGAECRSKHSSKWPIRAERGGSTLDIITADSRKALCRRASHKQQPEVSFNDSFPHQMSSVGCLNEPQISLLEGWCWTSSQIEFRVWFFCLLGGFDDSSDIFKENDTALYTTKAAPDNGHFMEGLLFTDTCAHVSTLNCFLTRSKASY